VPPPPLAVVFVFVFIFIMLEGRAGGLALGFRFGAEPPPLPDGALPPPFCGDPLPAPAPAAPANLLVLLGRRGAE
jgi:hypothetical protein